MKAFRSKLIVIMGFLVFAYLTAFCGAGRLKTKSAEHNIQRTGKLLADFLASARIQNKTYSFDHDGDGISDMHIFPLLTTNPDLKTNYITLEEALQKKLVILKEDVTAPVIDKKEPPTTVIAQIGFGTGLGFGPRPGFGFSSRYGPAPYGGVYGSRSGYGFGRGGSPLYYGRGAVLGGGWQGRGFGRGGIIGGYNRPTTYGPYRPTTSGGFGKLNFKNDDPTTTKLPIPVAYDGAVSPEASAGPTLPDIQGVQKVSEIKLDALCFEKWRLIKQARLRGESEYFTYAGMASPTIRKKLVLFPNQTNIHVEIEKELRGLGVPSKTKAFIDILEDPRIKKVIDYYVNASSKIPEENKRISGIIIADRNRILAADLYSSPQLFRKMFPQLIQSAAIELCLPRPLVPRTLGQEEVERFLDELRKTRNVKTDSVQTCRFFSRKLVGAAELYGNDEETRVVHIEAYPR